jgi:hypothetical protein
LRRDELWKSWDWVTDEWAQALAALGAEVAVWRAPIGKGEQLASNAAKGFGEFLADIDAGIFGLCNCGSCTLWAVHDAIAALDMELPSLTVATTHFEKLARKLAQSRGRAELRMVVLPFPLEGRPEPEVRAIARAHLNDALSAFGAVTR